MTHYPSFVPQCLQSAAGCKNGFSTYHFCVREPGHEGPHRCDCGAEFPQRSP